MTMWGYFFALLAPIVLVPLIPFFGRLIGGWWVNRPDSDRRAELSSRLDAFRKQNPNAGLRSDWGRHQSGMSLIEILVALPIIMVGLVGLMSAIPYAASNIQAGNTGSTSTFLANSKIEQIKGLATSLDPANPGYLATYAVDNTGCTGIANDPITALAGTEADVPVNGFQNTGYSRTTTVATDPGVCPMKTITVAVSYRGNPQSVVTLRVAAR